MAMDKSDLDTLEEVQDKDYVKNKVHKMDFSSPAVLIGGVVGLGYALIARKNKVGWTLLGVIAGAIIGKFAETATK